MDEINMLSSLLKSMGNEGRDIAKNISGILIDRQVKSLFLLKLNEFKKEMSTLKQPPKLTKTEKKVLEFVQQQKKPVTRDDIIEKFGESVKSLQYETHASIILNSLVKKGFLGKAKIEGIIYFMLPEDAVSQALSAVGKLAYNIKTEEDILKICKSTGMPAMSVISVLNEIGY